jgi:hypothetical protein
MARVRPVARTSSVRWTSIVRNASRRGEGAAGTCLTPELRPSNAPDGSTPHRGISGRRALLTTVHAFFPVDAMISVPANHRLRWVLAVGLRLPQTRPRESRCRARLAHSGECRRSLRRPCCILPPEARPPTTAPRDRMAWGRSSWSGGNRNQAGSRAIGLWLEETTALSLLSVASSSLGGSGSQKTMLSWPGSPRCSEPGGMRRRDVRAPGKP